MININPEMCSDWRLHAYCGRFKNISLDPDLKTKRDFLLIKNDYYLDTLKSGYEILNLIIVDFKFLKKK
jgi:hypothetical protein